MMPCLPKILKTTASGAFEFWSRQDSRPVPVPVSRAGGQLPVLWFVATWAAEAAALSACRPASSSLLAWPCPESEELAVSSPADHSPDAGMVSASAAGDSESRRPPPQVSAGVAPCTVA